MGPLLLVKLTNKHNNHFIGTGSTPVSYDAAGNITSDGKFRNMLFGYDANGRQNYSAQLNGSGPSNAIYDGAGQRVADKVAGSLNIMVYDAGGKLAAEYAQVTAPTTANIQYVTNNYQGSPSVITDNSGNVTSRHDYLPFGEEIGAGVGSRNTTKLFSQTDNVRQKYAGMETDDATGMNHTLWRKDDNLSGRWTSPDPYGGSMSSADPQSFNRYTYCDNDPIDHADPSGLSLADIGVYQTEDSAEAAAVQTGSDIEQREAIKQQQHNAWFSSLTIQQKIWVMMHPGGPVQTSGGDVISNTPSMRQTQTPKDLGSPAGSPPSGNSTAVDDETITSYTVYQEQAEAKGGVYTYTNGDKVVDNDGKPVNGYGHYVRLEYAFFNSAGRQLTDIQVDEVVKLTSFTPKEAGNVKVTPHNGNSDSEGIVRDVVGPVFEKPIGNLKFTLGISQVTTVRHNGASYLISNSITETESSTKVLVGRPSN